MTADNPAICEIAGGHRPPLQTLLPTKRILFESQNPARGISRELLGMRNDDLCHAFTIQFAHDIEYLVDELRIQL